MRIANIRTRMTGLLVQTIAAFCPLFLSDASATTSEKCQYNDGKLLIQDERTVSPDISRHCPSPEGGYPSIDYSRPPWSEQTRWAPGGKLKVDFQQRYTEPGIAIFPLMMSAPLFQPLFPDSWTARRNRKSHHPEITGTPYNPIHLAFKQQKFSDNAEYIIVTDWNGKDIILRKLEEYVNSGYSDISSYAFRCLDVDFFTYSITINGYFHKFIIYADFAHFDRVFEEKAKSLTFANDRINSTIKGGWLDEPLAEGETQAHRDLEKFNLYFQKQMPKCLNIIKYFSLNVPPPPENMQ